MNEEWKEIFKGYEVSNLGQVRKCINSDEYKILHQVDSGDACVVSINGKQYRVHSLVARAFIDNPLNHKCVIHLDDDYTNNCVDNLQWSSRYSAMLRKKSNNIGTKINCEELKSTFNSITCAELVLGIPKQCILHSIETHSTVFGYTFNRDLAAQYDNVIDVSVSRFIEASLNESNVVTYRTTLLNQLIKSN